jgi:mRNA-degrading endonuclease RelE of RelBE toxin-antitoxin system
MGFKVVWTKAADGTFRQLEADARAAFESRLRLKKEKVSKQEGLFKQVRKAIELLLENPRHPGLHSHEYDSIPHPFVKDGKVFEAYAQNRTPGAYRIFWCYGPEKEQITIIAITPHP